MFEITREDGYPFSAGTLNVATISQQLGQITLAASLGSDSLET